MNDLLLPCRALLFDSDGVLVDSDASVFAAWARWATSYDLDPAQVTAMVHGRRAADTVALLLPSEFREQAVRRIELCELEDAAGVTAVPGAVALTESVPPGWWAVVTSATCELAGARLRAAGISPPVVVTAEDVVWGKPDPAGYLLAADRLGVPAGDCIVLEDSSSGIAAARRAGVSAVVGIGERALETDADVVVPDLRGLRLEAQGLRVDLSVALRVTTP